MNNFFRMFLLFSLISIGTMFAMDTDVKVGGQEQLKVLQEQLDALGESLAARRAAVADDEAQDTTVEESTTVEFKPPTAPFRPYRPGSSNKVAEEKNTAETAGDPDYLSKAFDRMNRASTGKEPSIEGATDWSESEKKVFVEGARNCSEPIEAGEEMLSSLVLGLTDDEILFCADHVNKDTKKYLLAHVGKNTSSNSNYVHESSDKESDEGESESSYSSQAPSVPERDDTTYVESEQGVAPKVPDYSEVAPPSESDEVRVPGAQPSVVQGNNQPSNIISLPLEPEVEKILDGPPLPPKKDGKVNITKLITLSTILGVMTYVFVHHYWNVEALDETNVLLLPIVK